MAKRSRHSRSARRRNRRYIGMLVLFVALIGGWSWFWHYAAGQGGNHHRRLARARGQGRPHLYLRLADDRRLSVPHRGELRQSLRAVPQQPAAGRDEDRRHADRRADLRADLADHRIPRPAHHRRSGQAADIIAANWKLGQSSVRGTPAAPERVSLVFDGPKVDRIGGGNRQNVLHAKRIEVHGRIVEGSADQPSGDRDRDCGCGRPRRRPCIRPPRSRSMPTSPRCCAG